MASIRPPGPLKSLELIFNAIVIPVIPGATFAGVEERVKELENSAAFRIFLNNKDKMVSKLPKLKKISEVMNRQQKHHQTTKWIESWFNRMQFIDTSVIHSIPTEFKDITLIVHKIMQLYTINNTAVIVHGSFAAFLLDNRIRYADMDVTCLHDDLIFLTSLLLYFLLGVKTHILSIPYIINHRQLRVDADTTSICDALRIDKLTANLAQTKPVEIAKGILINVQHAATQFLNYFKMLHLSDRRKKIKHYKENQKLILNAVYRNLLSQIKLTEEQLMKVIPYTIQIDASIQGMIIMRLRYLKLSFTIFFHTGYQDADFIPALRNMLGVSDNDREMIVFNQLCSLFPEQCIEVIDANESVLHINMSRNEVYKVITTEEIITGEASVIQIDSYSVINMLAIIGLHYFFTRKETSAEMARTSRSIEPFIRIISTIIHWCNSMVETPNQILYDRTKNSGDHIIRTIFGRDTYIKSRHHETAITVYELPPKTLEMKVKENCSIEDYYRLYKR